MEDAERQIAEINFKVAQDIKNEYLNSSVIEGDLNVMANISIAELRFRTAENMIFLPSSNKIPVKKL